MSITTKTYWRTPHARDVAAHSNAEIATLLTSTSLHVERGQLAVLKQKAKAQGLSLQKYLRHLITTHPDMKGAS